MLIGHLDRISSVVSIAIILMLTIFGKAFIPSRLTRQSSKSVLISSLKHTISKSSSFRGPAIYSSSTQADGFNDGSIPQASIFRQIFCNVELNGESLEAVGFDMDFTLAQYKESFDLLAFEGAKHKLVNLLGYPKDAVLNFVYDSNDFRRGLIIDKKRGNVLKIDRHKYVRKAYHGLSQEISSKDRKEIYSKQVATFTESNYVNIDTLFHPVDAVLFSNLVELKDNHPGLITKSYEDIYKDVRMSVDLCHRDGVIKDTVMKDPESYIIYDENIVPLMKRLKKAGKKVFLLTNSMWEYTTKVMEFLVHGRGANQDIDWKDLFDVVIVGACKPAFLTDTYLSVFLVNENGYLRNVDDNMLLGPQYLKNVSKTFQGGCWVDLHRMLRITSGDKILYVGDHMFADILRSKRTLGWRTCLIIPELEHELEVANREQELEKEVVEARRQQYIHDDYVDMLKQKRANGQDVDKELDDTEKTGVQVPTSSGLTSTLHPSMIAQLKEKVRALNEAYNSRFNKVWGQLFKAGHQDSRFAKQVMDYACLYTSRASNLAFVYPNRSFRPVQDFMPHDQALIEHRTSKSS